MKMSADEEEPSKYLQWSKTSLHEIAFKEYFPSAVKDLSVQKDIITRFLKFYSGSRVQKGMGVDDLVFAVLSILPVSPYKEEGIWGPVVYKDDGKAFFLTPEERLSSDFKTVINKTNDVQNPTEETEEPSEQNNADNAEDSPNILNNIDSFDLSDWIELNDDDDDYIDEIFTRTQDKSEQVKIDNGIKQYDHEIINETNTDVHDKHVSKDPVDEINSSILKDFPKKIQFPLASAPIQTENKILNYGPAENAAFNACCNKLLSVWDTNPGARAVLKSFFAVVALVLMRATTKSYKHLVSTFHGEKFLRLLRHSFKCGLESYSPPHKRCLKGAYRTFRRRDGKTPTMFAKLVALVISDKLEKYLKYVILNGLMNYTADYGFNLIRLLRTICSESIDSNMKQVMELTLCEETAASWKKVATFLNEYYASSSSGKEYFLSYRWARVLDGRFFKDLSCQQNYGLAVIFNVFVEKIKGNPEVWQSTWVENDELEKYRALGIKFYERFESQGRERPSTNGAGKVTKTSTDRAGKVTKKSTGRAEKVTKTSTDGAGKVTKTSTDGAGEVPKTSTDGAGKVTKTSTDAAGKVTKTNTDGAGKVKKISTNLLAFECDNTYYDIIEDDLRLEDCIVEVDENTCSFF